MIHAAMKDLKHLYFNTELTPMYSNLLASPHFFSSEAQLVCAKGTSGKVCLTLPMKYYESALSSEFRLNTNDKEKVVEDCPEGEQKVNTLFASFCVSNRHTLPDAFAHSPTRNTLIVNGFILNADEEA